VFTHFAGLFPAAAQNLRRRSALSEKKVSEENEDPKR
jgi:hypothetical protein